MECKPTRIDTNIKTFYSFDLDLNPMILILKLDLDMVKIHLYSEKEVPSFSSLKVIS